MLALIAFPLFFRSIFIMGVVVSDYSGRLIGRGVWLAGEIIYILTTLAIYAGIVAIGRHFAKSPQPPSAPNGVNPSYGPNFWNGPGLPPHHAAKPNMVVHEVAPPPLYQQQGHGNAQYSMPIPPPQHQPYLNQQPYPTPYQQQHQQPQQQQSFQIQGYPQYPQHQHQQQQVPSPRTSPPPPQPASQPYMNPTIQTSPQHHTPPSEVSGTTNLSELPSPIHTPAPHAR